MIFNDELATACMMNLKNNRGFVLAWNSSELIISITVLWMRTLSQNTLSKHIIVTHSSWCSAGWSTKKVLQKLPDQFIDFKLTKFEIKGAECYKCLNTEWMETVRSYPPGEVFRHSDSDMLNDTWIEKVYNLGSKLDHRLSDVLNSDHFHLLLR